METISDRLKKLRKDKGITQAKLAELLHLTDKAISKWESGEGNPDIGSLPAIAAIFEVSVDYLLTGKRPEKNQLVIDGLLLNMNDEQRIHTILENDSWDSFVKFGYDKLNPLVRLPAPHREENKLNPLILKSLYEFKSKKVFSNLIFPHQLTCNPRRNISNAISRSASGGAASSTRWKPVSPVSAMSCSILSTSAVAGDCSKREI